MAQFNSQEFRSSYGHRGKRLYYCYGDDLYAGTFPEEWAQDHAPGTGPGECGNCRNQGSWNGVFMLYCANCAINVYNGERGKGAISPGEEYDCDENREFRSAFQTYLYDVNLNDVGDTDFRDSLAEVFNYYASEFSYHNPLHVLAGLKRMNDELCCDSEDAEHVDYFMDTTGTAHDMSEEPDSDAAAGAADYDNSDYDNSDSDDSDADDHVSAVDRADNDYDYEGEYDRRRQWRDSRTVCYENDDDLPRQQYIPSKGECVPNSFDNAAQEEEPDKFVNFGTGESWRNSLRLQRRRFDEHDDLSNDEDSDENWYSGITAEQYRRDQGIKSNSDYENERLERTPSTCLWSSVAQLRLRLRSGSLQSVGDSQMSSLNTQDSVPDPDIPLDETVHCMVCENTIYNCACGDIDEEDNLDIMRKTHQFCLDYQVDPDDERALLRQLVGATLPTQNMDVDEAEPDDVKRSVAAR